MSKGEWRFFLTTAVYAEFGIFLGQQSIDTLCDLSVSAVSNFLVDAEALGEPAVF